MRGTTRKPKSITQDISFRPDIVREWAEGPLVGDGPARNRSACTLQRHALLSCVADVVGSAGRRPVEDGEEKVGAVYHVAVALVEAGEVIGAVMDEGNEVGFEDDIVVG